LLEHVDEVLCTDILAFCKYTRILSICYYSFRLDLTLVDILDYNDIWVVYLLLWVLLFSCSNVWFYVKLDCNWSDGVCITVSQGRGVGEREGRMWWGNNININICNIDTS
jgi:hypothetical protein